MGLLNASMFGALPASLQQQQGMGPVSDREAGMLGASQPGMGPMSNNDFLGAFQNNPQFMQQLQAIQNGQGPGRQMPQFTPPPMQMSTSVQGMGARGASFGGGNPINNYGMQMGDPGTYFMGLLGRPQG